MTHLVRVARKPPASGRPTSAPDAFPFAVPAIHTLPTLELAQPVTCFVGENGTGKSTLLEAIAIAAEVQTLGSAPSGRDPTLDPQRALARELRLSWTRRVHRGFFLRAEDYFGFLKAQAREDARLRREARERHGVAVDEALRRADDGEHPDERDAAAYLPRYDARSHGESFLDLFVRRVHGPGLYLLDEPETPLSPLRQIALVSLLMDAVQEGAQFIVATHSPILLACPGAAIVSFDTTPISTVAYEALEHVQVTRDFLNHPQRFLRHLG